MNDDKGIKDSLLVIGLLAAGFMLVWIIYTGLMPSPAIPPGYNTSREVLEQELEGQANASLEGLISISENQSAVMVLIRSTGSGPRFALGEYQDEFIRFGMHSDSFIRLDQSRISTLNESESLWLMPMLRNGSGVLFNAIYSNDVSDCNTQSIDILGKRYLVSQLQNGSAFESDDKWKVGLDYEDGCLKRVVVYLDGYFYDLKDGEQLSLFGNDERIMFGFMNLSSQPAFEVVAAKGDQSAGQSASGGSETSGVAANTAANVKKKS